MIKTIVHNFTRVRLACSCIQTSDIGICSLFMIDEIELLLLIFFGKAHAGSRKLSEDEARVRQAKLSVRSALRFITKTIEQ